MSPRIPHLPAVIVGAGPYGLSLASHLRQAGVPCRIFGQPMQSWATQMPKGMMLKSDGFASNLSTGSTPFTLEDFCRLTNRPYHPTQVPVALEDFIAYGLEFAQRYVPHLEQVDVTSIAQVDPSRTAVGEDDLAHPGFHVTLSTGESFFARRVILATGLSLFQYLPRNLAALSKELVTHTTEHRQFTEFAGRDVVVLGRGASSLNAAALLHEAGSRVTLLTRRNHIRIHSGSAARSRSLFERLRYPTSPLGPSLRSWLSSNAPHVFHALPAPLRRLLVYKHLGPAGGSFLKDRVEGKFPILLGWTIESSELVPNPDKTGSGERLLKLILLNEAGERRQLLTSHIIAGTGFRVSLSRLRFLSESLRARIRTDVNGAPCLNRNFESTVRGLYFIGPAGSASFGPLLRFAAGADFAAAGVTRHLRRVFGLASTPTAEPLESPSSNAHLTR